MSMPKISSRTLFFDIGGVLLTNAWDTAARKQASEAFSLDWSEFEPRHGMLKTAFETGRLSLDAYIRKSLFHRSRSFSPDDFKAFMFSRSQLLGETLEWVRKLARSGKHRLFTLNNESQELHEYRVKSFQMEEMFSGFLASCYLGQAKPDEGIYLSAIGIASCSKKGAIFIDDRALNVEPAEALGLAAFKFSDLDDLRARLKHDGIEA
jgi:putative hydrolase of the HAD superfamily